jgi:flagellin
MPLGVLNNISAIYAENNLNQTQASLQKTLTELSSGSRINSGADDSAGLAIANGLQANSSALTQSSANATAGVGFLQVADGALSQVTNLLNRAVTLATEAGGGTLSATQMSAADQEYQDILGQINTIGSTTEYNGIQVFSSDQTVTALGWGANAVGSATSATATSGAIAGAAITAGGSATVAAPVQTATYGSATNMSWSLNGTAATSTLTSSVIPNGGKLSGTLAFSPTTSGGTASAISIDLSTVTGATLSAQATSLATLINAQAGNSGGDYTVTAVGNNQLQIGLGANASTDHIIGFTGAPATGSATGGAAAAQTGFTLTVVDGGTLGGSIAVTPNTTVAAGAQTAVNFTNNGATITANLPVADNIGGSITIGGNITQAGGVATALSWTNNSGTYTAAIGSGNSLSGGFTITNTGGSNPATVDIDLTGKDSTNVVAAINTALGANAADYTVGYSGGTLSIAVNGTPASGLTAISVANDVSGVGAATQTTPITRAAGTSPTKTIDLSNVTTADLQSTLNADLAGSDYSATYNSGTGALSFGISAAGTTAGVAALTISGSPTVFKQTPASVTPGSTTNISLANVTTANLATVVGTALNGASPSNPDYTVTYSSGTLTVALTAHGTTTDNIASLGLANSATEKSPTAASIQFTDGEQLSGQFTITPTVSGVASNSPITVSLNGHSTSDLVATVNAALNANSPGSASNYDVAYNVSNGVGTLSIAANATGLAANVDSVAIANGTSTNAMGYSGVAMTNINPANTVMGNFTLTPTTASGPGSAINVNLQGVTNANLLSAVQHALNGSTGVGNYTVAYDTTANSPTLGNLSISVSSAGAAAGITGFTVAEAASQAASQEAAAPGGVSIYTSDGTSTGSKNYNVTVGALSNASVGTSSASSVLGSQYSVTVAGVTGTGGVSAGGTAGTSLTGTNLTSQAGAEAALQTVTNAISAVAFQRGQVGANINTLTAAANIAASEQTNITSASNAITATDYASATSNMSKFEILTQTGISALAQANSTQQMVTKLLQ